MTGPDPTGKHHEPPTARWTKTRALAIVFGLAAVPWTYVFVEWLPLPLWPSFVASASVFAAGGGRRGLVRGAAGNVTGIAYATATLLVVSGSFGGRSIALALVVGGFMLLASLHAEIPVLSFAPGAFLGFAATFGVDAAGTGLLGGGHLAVAVATVASMLLGAAIAVGTDLASDAIT